MPPQPAGVLHGRRPLLSPYLNEPWVYACVGPGSTVEDATGLALLP